MNAALALKLIDLLLLAGTLTAQRQVRAKEIADTIRAGGDPTPEDWAKFDAELTAARDEQNAQADAARARRGN